MKTYHLKDLLKKELLIIETPLNVKDVIFNKGDNSLTWETEHLIISGYDLDDYTLLGKPDEISEEDARELVEVPEPYWEDNKNQKVIGNAKWSYAKSLLSLIESEIYWENPIPTPEIQGKHDEFGNFHGGWDDNWISAFEEAEQKTFDRKRTIIFKKN